MVHFYSKICNACVLEPVGLAESYFLYVTTICDHCCKRDQHIFLLNICQKGQESTHLENLDAISKYKVS